MIWKENNHPEVVTSHSFYKEKPHSKELTGSSGVFIFLRIPHCFGVWFIFKGFPVNMCYLMLF